MITIAGWWVWNFFLEAIYPYNPSLSVKDGFTYHFGANPTWWLTFLAITFALVVLDLSIDAVKKWWWPTSVEIWQELEQDERVKEKLREVGGEGRYSVGLWDERRGEMVRGEEDEEEDDAVPHIRTHHASVAALPADEIRKNPHATRLDFWLLI